VLGLATLEAFLSKISPRIRTVYNDIGEVQHRTGHLGGLVVDSMDLKVTPNFHEVSREVSRINQLVSWYQVIWKSYLRLCEFMEQSATRSEALEEAFEDSNIPGYPTRSPATMEYSEMFSELLSTDKSRILHQIEHLTYYKELCVIQNQNVRPGCLAKCTDC
jgi:hypothetical protein